MTRFNFLACLFAVSLAITACSSGNEGLKLGSRDDIIIMNNGVPVDGSPKPTAVASAEMPETAVAMVEPAAQEVDVIDSMIDETMDEVTQVEMQQMDTPMPEKVEAMAEAVKEEPTTLKVAEQAPQEMMEKVEEVKSEVVETVTTVKTSNPEIMERVTMKGSKPAPQPEAEQAMMDQAAEDAMPEEPVQEAKVEGGCYKQVVVPAVIGTDGKVAELPKLEERRGMCAQDMNSGIVAIVQQALISVGYKTGAPDGKAGERTIAALEAYQQKNGLGMGGFTFETLKHLNIKPE